MANIFLGEPSTSVKQWIVKRYFATPFYFEGQEAGATVAMIAWNGIDY